MAAGPPGRGSFYQRHATRSLRSTSALLGYFRSPLGAGIEMIWASVSFHWRRPGLLKRAVLHLQQPEYLAMPLTTPFWMRTSGWSANEPDGVLAALITAAPIRPMVISWLMGHRKRRLDVFTAEHNAKHVGKVGNKFVVQYATDAATTQGKGRSARFPFCSFIFTEELPGWNQKLLLRQ